MYPEGSTFNSSSVEAVTPRPASAEREVSGTQLDETSQPVQQASEYVQDQLSWVSSLRDDQNVQPGSTTLTLTPRKSMTNSPENTYVQTLLPGNLSYHSGPSPASGVGDDCVVGSVSSGGPVIDVAIAKWFGLLACDANLENSGFLNAEDEIQYDLNALERQTEQALGTSLTTQRSGQIHQVPGRGEESVRRPSLYPNDETLSQAGAAVLEDKPWQSSETLPLTGHEYFFFENFVKRVSHWVLLLIRLRIPSLN
jgi:hypothetical protein